MPSRLDLLAPVVGQMTVVKVDQTGVRPRPWRWDLRGIDYRVWEALPIPFHRYRYRYCCSLAGCVCVRVQVVVTSVIVASHPHGSYTLSLTQWGHHALAISLNKRNVYLVCSGFSCPLSFGFQNWICFNILLVYFTQTIYCCIHANFSMHFIHNIKPCTGQTIVYQRYTFNNYN